jgi:Na+/melibiose symporter-like transporter
MTKGKAGKPNLKLLLGKVKGYWKTPPEGRYLTLKETVNFGLYSLGVSFMTSAVNYVATIAFIPYFYKIDTIHAYIIVALSSFFNLILLPFIANKIEKTRTKWGRYKPYILFSAPLFAVLALLVMWVPQFQKESARIIYAYLTCLPVLILSAFSYNMYQTMPTILTPNGQERADIMTPIGLIFGFAPSVLQVVAGPIRGYFKDRGMEYMGLRVIGIFSVAVGLLLVMLILKSKERVYRIQDQDEKERIKMKEAFSMLSKNKALVILCLALVLGSMREFTNHFRWLIIQFRFAADVKTAIGISGIPMSIIGFAATVSMLLMPIVTRKMDKNKIIILFSTLGIISNAILGFVGYQRIPVGITSVIVVTLLHFISCINPAYLLVPVMLGELADNQQLLTGKRLDGHLQNLLFVTPGLFSQLFMILAWFWQKKIGFEARDYTELAILTDAQQAVACSWFNAASIISVISGVLMITVLFFYPLSRKKHAEIVSELNKIAVLTNEDAAPARN